MNNKSLRLKPCTGFRCKKLIPQSTKGSFCNECKTNYYRQYSKSNSDTDVQKFYNSSRWRKVKRIVSDRANHLCEICSDIAEYGGDIAYRGTLGEQVHHIVKVIDNEELRYDPDNLLLVCRRHHEMIEGMNKEQLLKALEDLSLKFDEKIDE